VYHNEQFLLERLLDTGYITNEDIDAAIESARGKHSTVDALIQKGVVTEEQITQTLAMESSMEYMDLSNFVPESYVLEAIPADVVAQYHVLPVGVEPGRVILAIGDPTDFQTMDTIPHVVRDFQVDFVCAPKSQIMGFLREFYNVDPAGNNEVSVGGAGEGDSTDDAPIIRMVGELLQEAFQLKASDIHVEPMEKCLRIRYRVDGVMVEVAKHPKHLSAPVLARLKIMTGSMSIDEKRIPQDGRIQARMGNRDLDLRVSTVPTNHGESVVMRILDRSSIMLGLGDMGFFADDHKTFNELLGLPDGIILVTGPTGSGKTTTLYACLNQVNRPDRKIITVEDPVEYQLSGINQVPVKEDVGMTFAAALKAMLRQAPNIIMLGEIRDGETAGIAIQAALTGHLVFSTLHTNDAPSAVARLADIGVKPFLVASAVRAFTAQRLVRKLCADCKQPGELTEKELRQLRLDASRLSDAKIMAPCGCPKCRQGGFKGRMCVVEIFRVDDQARQMINENLPATQLKRRAREIGMRTLREDGIRKMMAGITTAAEVIESTNDD
jgi:type IV pilus assembly protein PilB